MVHPGTAESRADGAAQLSRRGFVVAALAAGACSPREEAASCPDLALRAVAPAPVGTCIGTPDLDDPALVALVLRHFSQLTPGWEMKMRTIVQADGTFRFTEADRIAAFARAHRLPLHGHTLVWYKHEPDAFARLLGQRAAFLDLYRRYIAAVVGRYRDAARGWDVVNEPVAPDGGTLRRSLWSEALGPEDYIAEAFAAARAASAPGAPLFVNDYDLEQPGKRATLLRLVERLLKRGVPVGGIGTQTHVEVDLPPGTLGTAIREIATLGLPIHVSELDIGFGHRRLDFRSAARKRALQRGLAREAAEAFAALPARQRYAFTLWGVRDLDSWLRQPPFEGGDQPLAFDDAGRRKPMYCGLLAGFRGAAPAKETTA